MNVAIQSQKLMFSTSGIQDETKMLIIDLNDFLVPKFQQQIL